MVEFYALIEKRKGEMVRSKSCSLKKKGRESELMCLLKKRKRKMTMISQKMALSLYRSKLEAELENLDTEGSKLKCMICINVLSEN